MGQCLLLCGPGKYRTLNLGAQSQQVAIGGRDYLLPPSYILRGWLARFVRQGIG